jgi:hypothetical protein
MYKLFQMVINYINILQPQALRNLSNLGFLATLLITNRKYTHSIKNDFNYEDLVYRPYQHILTS